MTVRTEKDVTNPESETQDTAHTYIVKINVLLPCYSSYEAGTGKGTKLSVLQNTF